MSSSEARIVLDGEAGQLELIVIRLLSVERLIDRVTARLSGWILECVVTVRINSLIHHIGCYFQRVRGGDQEAGAGAREALEIRSLDRFVNSRVQKVATGAVVERRVAGAEAGGERKVTDDFAVDPTTYVLIRQHHAQRGELSHW